jgi:sodium-coupled neutral amino acid transporter 11
MLPEDGKEVEINNSDISTFFLILNTMIGSGILVQPYMFSQAGIVAAIFEYIIISFMTFFGAEIMIRSSDKTNIFDLSSVGHHILGEYFGKLVDFAIFIHGAGALLSYIIIIGSLFTDVVNTGSDSCDGWYCDKVFLTILPIVCFTVPLCLIRRFGHLAVISYLSIIVVGAAMLLVIFGGPVRRQYYVDDDSNHIETGNFIGCIKTIGDVVFALGYLAAIFHTYHAHGRKNTDAFVSVTFKTTFIGVAMCFLTGLFGYLSFRDETETNILSNFPGVLGAIFKMGVIIHLLLYIPGDFVVLRASLWKLFNTDVSKQSDLQFLIVTLGCIGIITLIAIILMVTLGDNSSLGIVTNLTGGIAGSFLYFIFPGVTGIMLYQNDLTSNQSIWLYRKGLMITGFGSLIFVLVFVSNFI